MERFDPFKIGCLTRAYMRPGNPPHQRFLLRSSLRIHDSQKNRSITQSRGGTDYLNLTYLLVLNIKEKRRFTMHKGWSLSGRKCLYHISQLNTL